jgi:hypothetical protein
VRLALVIALLWEPSSADASAAKAQYASAAPSNTRLGEIRANLLQSSQDLLELAGASYGIERDIAGRLADVAGVCSEYFSVAQELVFLRDRMVHDKDRALVSDVLKARLTYYLKLIENRLSVVSLNLASTNKPAIADSGARLRDTLREGNELLATLGK